MFRSVLWRLIHRDVYPTRAVVSLEVEWSQGAGSGGKDTHGIGGPLRRLISLRTSLLTGKAGDNSLDETSDSMFRRGLAPLQATHRPEELCRYPHLRCVVSLKHRLASTERVRVSATLGRKTNDSVLACVRQQHEDPISRMATQAWIAPGRMQAAMSPK